MATLKYILFSVSIIQIRSPTIPIEAAYERDLTRFNFCMNKKYSAGINPHKKPANGHHLKGIGSLISVNLVLQWLQLTVYAVPCKKYLE